MPNHLAGATSPYLLQHADNPVDWWPWGDEAFAAAARRDVPVFVSIGYASCHWCHVMAHESFEDPQVAERLNRGFVAVKVDREEHPAVDAAYIRAAVALTGQAGWPLSVFTAPDGRPFYTGTYYPARPLGRIPAFTQVLDAVATAWSTQRADVLASAERIAAHLVRAAGGASAPSNGPEPAGQGSLGVLTPAQLDAAVQTLASEYDAVHGGFGGAPKFPPSTALGFLARHHARTGDRQAFDMLAGTCRAMATGGIYDQLRGGFARYSVDAGWVVPHFEKMLYDNALLTWDYLAWWRVSGDPLAERVVRETAAFLLTDLRTPQGGFAASLDADTVLPGPGGPRRVEGASYVWTRGDLVDALGPQDADWAADLLGVTGEGTVGGGASTLRLTRDLDGPGADPTEVRRWAGVRARLRAAREARPAPERDDKVVTAWNALAVAALTSAGTALREPGYVQAAAEAADLLLRVHLAPEHDGVLRRTSRDGRAGPSAGLLEDYAGLVGALTGLAEATGEVRWRRAAGALADRMIGRFSVPGPDGRTLLAAVAPADVDPRLAAIDPPGHPGEFDEQATPSGRALAAWALARLAAGTGSQRYREVAEAALTGPGGLLVQRARFVAGALAATEALLAGGGPAPG